MDVIPGRTPSRLNPYAPPFVPVAHRAVPDFSPEWWQMVEESAGLRDYCFRPSSPPPQDEDGTDELLDISDVDSLFHSYHPKEEEREAGELMPWGAEKWWGTRGRSDGHKGFEKAAKVVRMKVSPRTIQQPR